MQRAVFFIKSDRVRLDDQGTAVGHGIAGIHAEIQQHLIELDSIRENWGEVRREGGLDLDVCTDHIFERVKSVRDAEVQIDVAGFKYLASSESEELPCETRCTLGLAANFFKVKLGARTDFSFCYSHVGPTDDGADHIVEIVRDAARQLADGLEFLCFQQLFFERETLGNIFNNHFQAFLIGCTVFNAAPIHSYGEDGTIFALPIDGGVHAAVADTFGDNPFCYGRVAIRGGRLRN